MRLFVVDGIPLGRLGQREDGPRPGDVVTWWRHAQDPDGSAGEALRRRGVTVDWAEGRIDDRAIDEVDRFVDRFGRNWYLRDGTDRTMADGFSFAEAVTASLHSRSKFGFLVRYGCIFEDLFDAYPDASEILTDFVDGANWLTGGTPAPHAFPRRQLLRDLARTRGIASRDLRVDDPLPATGFHGDDPLWRPMLRSFLGGFRPLYLGGRLRLRFSRKILPRLYLFMTAGLAEVAKTMAKRDDVEVMGDWKGLSGVLPLRHDHFAVVPSWSMIKAVRRLRRIARVIGDDGFEGDIATHQGIDYAPYLVPMIQTLVRRETLPAVIVAAQMRRMIKIAQPDVMVINGEGSIAARLTVAMADANGYKVAFIDHSNTLVPYGPHPCGRNFENVIYVAQGDDHVDSYGRQQPEGHKPRRPVLTNPATSAMDRVRGLRQRGPGRRVLLTNFSAAATYSIARIPFEDRYVIEMFEAVRLLVAEGYEFTYRPHPGYNNPAYIDYMLDRTGLAQHVRLDDVRDFPDSLPRHDLLVANVTGCLYQALYAGWPTVFFEPEFDPKRFVGLPAVTDLDWPVASTPGQLAELIRDGLERPDGSVARFPELFNTIHAHRFIGRDADRADEVLADFLVDEIPGRAMAGEPARPTARAGIAAE